MTKEYKRNVWRTMMKIAAKGVWSVSRPVPLPSEFAIVLKNYK